MYLRLECWVIWGLANPPNINPSTERNSMKNTGLALILSLLIASPAIAEDIGTDIEAVTAKGDKVILQPNGRWKFVEKEKAVEAEKIASQYRENQGCPPGTQGGFLGFGRCIPLGDKDYNRGSLGGKGR